MASRIPEPLLPSVAQLMPGLEAMTMYMISHIGWATTVVAGAVATKEVLAVLTPPSAVV
jgi:hypothetical protein